MSPRKRPATTALVSPGPARGNGGRHPHLPRKLLVSMALIRHSLLAALIIFALWGCDRRDELTRPPSNKIIVLGYHGIGTGDANYNTSVADFEGQVAYLLAQGYKPVSMAQLYGYLYNREKIPEKSFILTFDDGEISAYQYVFPFLVKNNLHAIFFVPTARIGADNALDQKQIQAINDNSCCDFGSHSVHHENLYTLTEKDLAEELRTSKTTLAKITGGPIISFAYPNGFFTQRDIAQLRQDGYKLAFTVLPGRNDTQISPYAIRRITVSNTMAAGDFKLLVDGNSAFYRNYYRGLYAKASRSGLVDIARLSEVELARY